jgi:large subunit ribosomal protein L6
MVQGVSQGYEKNLEISGVGYRVAQEGEGLVLQVGYSRPVAFSPPEGVGLQVEGNNRIKVLGIDKELVGEVAARLRRIRPPDAYKGKGIRYAGEKLRLKPGKAGRVGLRK